MELFSKETPPLEAQQAYWARWNRETRTGGLDPYMADLREEALRWVRPGRILEVGCGTGWLTAELAERGPALGVDLVPEAIETARQRGSKAEFMAGDFLSMEIPGTFSLAISVDAIAHVPDQAAFVRRVADLLEPGGLFVLLTQNEFVYRRTSWIRPPEPGQIRRWPGIGELRQTLSRDFELLSVHSAAPFAGDRGLMRLANSFVWPVLRRITGRTVARKIFCRLMLGRELVFVARKR